MQVSFVLLLLLLPFIWMTFFSKYVKLIFDIIIAAIIIGINCIIIVLVVQIIIIKFTLNNNKYYINDKMKVSFNNNNKWLKQIFKKKIIDDITLPPRFAWLLQDRLQFGYRPADARFSLRGPSLPSGPFCLGSQWISLSFHHSLMSSCSCQHLLTAGNSSLHTGSWDPRHELQSAIRRGGCTPSWANQGKHPFKGEGEGAHRQIEPKLPP